MPLDDPLAPDVARLLHDAADLAPDPPAAALADAARDRHRRHRRRQRAAVAAAPVGGAWLEQLSGRFISDTLVGLLPPGTVGDLHGYGTDEGAVKGAPPLASLTFDDGKGAGLVNLTFDRTALPITDLTRGTQCIDPVEHPVEGCERTVLPDGGIVVIDKLAPVEPMKVREWRITYTGTPGRQVRLWELNSTSAGPPLTRPTPPLTFEQLTAVATSKAWDQVFAAGARPGTPGAPAPAGVAAFAPQEVVTTTVAVLPPGTTNDPGAPQHTAGQAHLAVQREGRASMLAVFVTPCPADGAAAAQRNFRQGAEPGALTQTPDGTLVRLEEMGATKSGGGPALRWIVEALHPDGTRVMVSEWNGKDDTQTLPGTPALTAEELKAIATEAAWRR